MLVNTKEFMPGEFSRNANMQFPRDGLRGNVIDAVGEDHAEFVDAGRIATALLGDSIAANMFMLGFAYQRGLIPIAAESIEAAIELNGAARQMNKDAFLWGRRTAVDANSVERLLVSRSDAADAGVSPSRVKTLEETISLRKTFLTEYQDAAYAQRYVDLVEKVRAVERNLFGNATALTEAVARYHFKLLAIKDEYEVARLHVHSAFLGNVAKQFEGDYKLVFNLAPPLISKRDAVTGELKKREFGGWVVPVFRVMSRLRSLRGTAFDIFGYSEERRTERAVLARYEETVGQALVALQSHGTASHHEAAIALASLPEEIRGYGHVRAKTLETARVREQDLLAQLQRRVIPLKRAA